MLVGVVVFGDLGCILLYCFAVFLDVLLTLLGDIASGLLFGHVFAMGCCLVVLRVI